MGIDGVYSNCNCVGDLAIFQIYMEADVQGIAMDIVARLRMDGTTLADEAADTIEFLRAQLARANCPVVDVRNSDRWRPLECGGFQGFED